MPIGVLLQTTKNKTYTPKNTCSGVSKDRSQRVSSLVLCYVNREQGFWGGGGGLSIRQRILRKTTKEQFKSKYQNQSREQTLV